MSQAEIDHFQKSTDMTFNLHSSATSAKNDEFAEIAATNHDLSGGRIPVLFEVKVSNQADVGQHIFEEKSMEVIIKKGTSFSITKVSKATIHDMDGNPLSGYRIRGTQK